MKICVTSTLLHHLARLHDIDAIGDAPHDIEIVGDEDHAHAEALAQIRHQIEDLGLDGDVERGRRFIGDQQVGIVGDRHGDHHALALAARHLVGVGLHAALGIGDSHELQQPQGLAARFIRRELAVMHDRLHQLVADGVERIERGHRLLEDHGDLPATDGVELAHREAQNIGAAIERPCPWHRRSMREGPSPPS